MKTRLRRVRKMFTNRRRRDPPGRSQGAPDPKARPLSGKTLAINQMLLEEERVEVQEAADQAGPETTVGQILTKRIGELDSQIAQVHVDRIEAIRTLLSEEMSGSPASSNQSGQGTPVSTNLHSNPKSQVPQTPFPPVGWANNPWAATPPTKQQTRSQLTDHDLAAIARILQSSQEESPDGTASEEASEQQPSESSQTEPASQQTSAPPQKKTNPQGLRAKIDFKRRGQGGYINADTAILD